MAEISGAGARRDFPATAFQTIAHPLAQPFGVVAGQLGADRCADHIARRLGHIAPCRTQVVQRSVDYGIEETCAALAHVRSRGAGERSALRCRSTGGSSSMMSSATRPGP